MIATICWFIMSSLLFPLSIQDDEQKLYEGNGTISFSSVAPLETIKASSDQLRGIIDWDKNTFAFTFPVKSFDGFNSALQKEHFNEHYLETDKYPNSTFTGKIIGVDECDIECETTVYAKGKLNIHGVTQLVTIPATFTKQTDAIAVQSDFKIQLSDYKISIPQILEAKISPTIDVRVMANFYASGE